MDQKRIVKALILGAIIGVTFEFVISPFITKPIEKKVEEIIKWIPPNLQGLQDLWQGLFFLM